MGSLDYHRTVIAYHGCDREVLRAVLDGRPLENSERAYDRLGKGVYFWEHGPERALEWAQKRAWTRRISKIAVRDRSCILGVFRPQGLT